MPTIDDLSRALLDEKAYPFWADHAVYQYLAISRGWFRLVSDLIDVLIALDPNPRDPRFRLVSIAAAPSGYLAITASRLNREQIEILSAASDLASTICVDCGKTGDLIRVTPDSNPVALCPRHFALAFQDAVRSTEPLV